MSKRVFDETVELKENSMLRVRPDLFDEWDFEKNDELGLDVYKVTKGMNKKAWWICKKGHKWDATIPSRTINGNGCAVCNNKKVQIGYNDMFSTNPKQARLLLNPEDGYKYTEGSTQRVDWKCPECQEIIKNKPIKQIKRYGLPCTNCNDGTSFPERVMYQLLKTLKIENKMETSLKWSKGKRYDFYFPTLNMIIEMNGSQHYGDGFKSMGGRSLEEEQENDRFKRQMALDNGIEIYIEIDCRSSEFEYVKHNIINSQLNTVFNLEDVEWKEVNLKSQKTLHVEVLELWNEGLSLAEISDKTKFHKHTVGKIVKKYESLGQCVRDTRRANNKALDNKKILVIYQLDRNFKVIKRWNNINEIVNELDYAKIKTISNSCWSGCTAYGFYWKYERDMKEDTII